MVAGAFWDVASTFFSMRRRVAFSTRGQGRRLSVRLKILWWGVSEKTGAGVPRPARGSWLGRRNQTQAFPGFGANQIAFVGVHGVVRFHALPRRSLWTWRPIRCPRHPKSLGRWPRPVLSDQEWDNASILAVLDRLQHAAGSADFGTYRRR